MYLFFIVNLFYFIFFEFLIVPLSNLLLVFFSQGSNGFPGFAGYNGEKGGRVSFVWCSRKAQLTAIPMSKIIIDDIDSMSTTLFYIWIVFCNYLFLTMFFFPTLIELLFPTNCQWDIWYSYQTPLPFVCLEMLIFSCAKSLKCICTCP